MVILNLKRAAEWIDTVAGVRLHCRPLTSAMMLAVKSDLMQMDIAAGDVDGMHAALTKAIARRSVFEWEGVFGEGDDPAPVTPDHIDALMDLHRIFEEFDRQIVTPYLLVQSEKNGFAPSPNGTSAGAPDIAAPATASATPAQAN
jgi:hypothetical protein